MFSNSFFLKVIQSQDHVVKGYSDDKRLTLSKLKAFADIKIIVAQMMICVIIGLENVAGKGGNAAFSPFLTMFSKTFSRVAKAKPVAR